MRIWVVKYGESIPFANESSSNHFFRSGEITRRLVARGHETTWWTGRFEHQTKRHLTTADCAVPIAGGTGSRVVLLDSPGYSKNVSPKRFYDHWRIGRNFRKAIQNQPKPDVILASMPTPELARAAADYASAMGVPLIVDVRDMWPDVIAQRLGERLGFSPAWLFRHYERDVRHSLNVAQSVTSITSGFLAWAQDKGHRSAAARSNDRVFRLASVRHPVASSREAEIQDIWRARGFDGEGGKVVFSLAGSLTKQRATEEFLTALTRLPDVVRRRIQVVICGRGDLENEVRRLAETCDHVLYAGFVARDEVQYLYDNSHFGLLMYDNTPDFQMSFPNKFGEYLMSGLVVLTTVTGVMAAVYEDKGLVTSVPATAEAIAALMTELAASPPSQAMRSKAREAFREDFDADIVYERFCDHIEYWGRKIIS